jgi:hypothetical protein
VLVGVVHVGCFAYARRKFFEAIKITIQPVLADAAFPQIKGLYMAERELWEWLKDKKIGSPAGTPNRRFVSSCELCMLIETAKVNSWNPANYLMKIFQKTAVMKSTDDWGNCFPGTSPYDFSGVTVIDA